MPPASLFGLHVTYPGGTGSKSCDVRSAQRIRLGPMTVIRSFIPLLDCALFGRHEAFMVN
jgi:hypothetical protein